MKKLLFAAVLLAATSAGAQQFTMKLSTSTRGDALNEWLNTLKTGVEAGSGGFERRDDAIALVRRRLCLKADRDGEIAESLGDRLKQRNGLWSAGPAEQRLVTLWWDRAG